MSRDVAETKRLLLRWYGDKAPALIRDVETNLGTRYVPLLVEPGIAGRADQFVKHCKPYLETHPNATPWELREEFSTYLGSETLYRGMVLTEAEARVVETEGILTLGMLRGPELAERSLAESLDSKGRVVPLDGRFPPARSPHQEVIARLTSRYRYEEAMWIPTSRFQAVARSVGYWASGRIFTNGRLRDGMRLYVYCPRTTGPRTSSSRRTLSRATTLCTRRPPMRSKTPQPPDELYSRLKRLGLYGVVSRWPELHGEPWLKKLAEVEESERKRRSLERRIHNAQIGTFKPMADFDWAWPKEIDRELVEEIFGFQFLRDSANVVLVGPNGIGKSMIAQNLAHQALLAGHTVRFTSASAMLNELAAQDSTRSLQRRLRRYVNPALLVIDEVGYLSYGNRHADLLFEVVTQRYLQRSVVITTNKSFEEWNEVFPNAACVVTLIDRLIHKAEVATIKGESYRLKEAKERAADRARHRTGKRKPRA